MKVTLRSRDEVAVPPYLASDPSNDTVALAYAGSTLIPGFGLSAAFGNKDFSIALTDPGGEEPVACGDILKPAAERYIDSGTALVLLEPVGGTDVSGFAVVQRTATQRELDITPTRARVVIFAPPVGAAADSD